MKDNIIDHNPLIRKYRNHRKMKETFAFKNKNSNNKNDIENLSNIVNVEDN